jgi:hypothetical protein
LVRVLFLIFFFFNLSLEAVPAFARNLGLDCSTCHTAYPQLTEFGKIFLQSAGDMLIQKDYGGVKMVPNPFSGHLYLDPIDKPFCVDSTKCCLCCRETNLRMHSIEEADIYMAGTVGKFFYFVVGEADNDDGFNLYVSEAYAAYQFSKCLNVFLGFASPFVLDANDTVFHQNVLYRQWKAADYVPRTSEMIGLDWHTKRFDAILSWHGADDDYTGINPREVSLRVALNCCHQTFGTYCSFGQYYDEIVGCHSSNRVLYGFDVHLRKDKSNLLMLLGFRNFPDRGTDFDFSIEANTIVKFCNKCVKKYFDFVIPMANLDIFIDRNTSNGLWVKGSAGFAFYFNPAVRVFPQIIGTIIAPKEYCFTETRFVITADIGI